MTYKAYYYLKSNGRAPLEEYFKKIGNRVTVAAIKALIDRLIQSKCVLPPKFIKPVSGKIYELRLAHFTNQHRVFYFIIEKGKIILLDGYIKKTDKIPKRILERIEKYYFNYLKCNHEKRYKYNIFGGAK